MDEQGLSINETFRLLTAEDFDAWFKVLKGGYATLKDLPISFESINATREDAAVWFGEIPFYGLFEGERLVASVGVRYPWGAKPGPEPLPHIGWVVTDPELQGHGYARKVLAHLEQEVLIPVLHVPAVTLGTAQEHPWLVSWYESQGFRPFRITQLPGKVHHTVFMRKVLEESANA